jgi:hypothetical protein
MVLRPATGWVELHLFATFHLHLADHLGRPALSLHLSTNLHQLPCVTFQVSLFFLLFVSAWPPNLICPSPSGYLWWLRTYYTPEKPQAPIPLKVLPWFI